MGIKNIYPELGPCKRVSLTKLAGDCLELNERPLRIAIDIAIWQFQNQAARGGTNPAIRTLFYRLVRLLATPIQPIFVFDGPHKPTIKRNKRSGRGDGVAIAMAKRLIRLFGFAVHDAPGEAEAECALLQRHGIVDAVLSEDVDTIMFGCTKTLRNWSAESKTAKTPTHVSMYDVHDMKLEDLGLDREGMVLVALMSGGDYLPDGIPGCGVKVACEAAKAGFGKSVCRLKASDKAGIQKWRDSLKHELRTNEHNFFRTKHQKLVIPDDFPNLEVLGYYTRPVVSPVSSLPVIRQKMEVKCDIQLEALREFTRGTFDWDYRTGAIKFVRVLGQALLVKNIAERTSSCAQHIKRISGRRTHFNTDSTPELRVSYIPEEVVPIDMTNEVDEVIKHARDGLALNSDEEFDAPEAVEGTPKLFDITKPDLAWILEGLVKTSAPNAFQEWQDKERSKAIQKLPKKKSGVTKSTKISGMPRGSLDRYVKTTKTSVSQILSKVPPLEVTPNPLTSSPPRPLARPSSSKQSSSSSTTKSPVRNSAVRVLDSSPCTPRSRKTQKQPEAIYISSSPPAAAITTSVPPSPSPLRPSSGPVQSHSQQNEMSRSMQPGSQKVSAKTLKAPPKKPPRKTSICCSTQQPQGSELKQSSMEIFVTKSKFPTIASSAKPKLPPSYEDDDSDLEPTSSLTRPLSSGKESFSKSTSSTQVQPGEHNRMLGSPKKKLLRVRTSTPGFYEEVELGAEEREIHSMAGAKKTNSAIRWSDVTFIDLT